MFRKKHPFGYPGQFYTGTYPNFNKYLAEGRYFWTDIAEEGIMLYDNGKFTLDTPCELNAQEFKGQVQNILRMERSRRNIL